MSEEITPADGWVCQNPDDPMLPLRWDETYHSFPDDPEAQIPPTIAQQTGQPSPTAKFNDLMQTRYEVVHMRLKQLEWYIVHDLGKQLPAHDISWVSDEFKEQILEEIDD